MTTPTVIAWAWGDRKWHDAATRLEAKCEMYDVPCRIKAPDLTPHFSHQLPNTTDRIWTFRYIPSFILQMLESLASPVLYMHVDMTIHGPLPEVEWCDHDVTLQPATSLNPPRPDSVLAAPLYFRCSEPAFRFLKLWKARCMNLDDDRSEHAHLHDVWRYMEEHDRGIAFGDFPEDFASIRKDSDALIRGHK